MNDLKKICCLLLIAGSFISFQSIKTRSVIAENPISNYYLTKLSELETDVKELEKSIKQRSSHSSLQHLFLEIRNSYKKVALLTEYYNSYETKLLNGPAIKWSEENSPQIIIEPQGLQVIEELLYNTEKELNYDLLNKEAGYLLNIISILKKEKDLDFKFSNEQVFEALQSSLIRLITLGISGFDSPIAQNSIAEAKITLESFKTVLEFYNNILDKKTPGLYQKADNILTNAINYLNRNTSFDRFDRLYFIKKYISPVYALIAKGRIENNLLYKNEKAALNPFATSLFDSNTFNINSFSPTNRYTPTPERIALGKKLFFDPILSSTKKRTCGTCHQPDLAFTDGLQTALAVDEKTYLLRNTPTLWNSALQRNQFFDSRATVLENQLSDVVHNQEEMKGSLKESVVELQKHPEYATLFMKAYPDDYEKITQYNIANAISSYMRSLLSFNSRFDLYMRGDESKMNKKEQKGFNLFMGKAKCGTCHFIPLFNGLTPPFFSNSESEVLGVPASKNKKPAQLDTDMGKYLFTKSEIHKHSFKTPTLRNIELTAPYMHNGVFNTLEEVMEFYNNGGGKGLNIAPDNQTLPFDKLSLSKKEIKAIIAFMRALTDTQLSKK